MGTYADQMDKFPPQAAPDRAAREEGAAADLQADRRPASAHLAGLQRMAQDSPRTAGLHTMQRMADTRGGTPNRTGLPDALKAGIERLSGQALDDVTVHFNSSKPAQLRAHAYTEGSAIYLGAGQERHLAHEAWHVVQQKQGRVAPTTRENGLPVNDDPQLEREADHMGIQALAVGPRMDAADLAPVRPLARGAPLQRKVIQKLSSQVTLDQHRRIIHVTVRGRPPRAHGSRMGDHSTAFIVHVEGLNVNLQGLTMSQAVQRIAPLGAHIVELLASQGSKVPSVLAEVELFNQHVHQMSFAANTEGGEDMAIHHLQLAINAYLRARELVPYSTINVAAVSPGLAGKGHGESRRVEVLSAAERNNASTISDDQLVEAIYGLFDAQAAGMVAVERDPAAIQALVGHPVKNDDLGSVQRMSVIWQQHLWSIAAMFPRCYTRVHGRLPVSHLEPQLVDLDQKNLEFRLSHTTKALARATLNVKNLRRELAKRTELPSRSGRFSVTTLSSIAGLYRELQAIVASLPAMARLDQRLHRHCAGEIEAIRDKANVLQQEIARLPIYKAKTEQGRALSTATHLGSQFSRTGTNSYRNELADLHAVTQGPPSAPGEIVYPSTPQYNLPSESEDDAANMMDVPAATEEASEDSDEEAEVEEPAEQDPLQDAPPGTLTGSTASMSIQLLLNYGDGRPYIEGMLSSGRPPSPFKGSMGAHSTAWIVHLDRVRTRLTGYTLHDAVLAMHDMIDETLALADTLNDKMLGDNAKDLIGAARAAIEQARQQDENLATIDAVQNMVGAMLAYLNLLPTISQDSTKTTGNAEGVWRKVLLDYEYENQGTKEGVQAAINGLFDPRDLNLRTRHMEFIEEAYPRAASFVRDEDVPEPGPRPVSNDLHDFSDDGTTAQKLHPGDVDAMRTTYTQENYLDRHHAVGRNNCLLNAIADAAGVAPPTIAQVIQIREVLNVPLGVMLAADRARLDLILAIMGLDHRGAIVFYHGQAWTDTTSEVSVNPLLIQHDGVNHFTAAHHLMPPVVRNDQADAQQSGSTSMEL